MLEVLGCAIGTVAPIPTETAADELPEEFLDFIADWDPEEFEDVPGVGPADVAMPARAIDRTAPDGEESP